MRSETDPVRFLRWTALLIVTGAAAMAVLNWCVDPLQFYRKATYPPLFQPAKRYQNPGLARTYDYDTVLIGTSISENFVASEVAPTIGGRFLNLAMSGATMHEQFLLLNVALRTGRVRTVLWELNYEYLRGHPDWVSDYDGPFPFYFYDNNPFNEFHNYLLSIDTLKASLRILAGLTGLTRWNPDPLERVQTWEWRKHGKKGPDRLRAVWTELRRPDRVRMLQKMAPEMTAEKMNRSFDVNALSLVRRHRQTRFIFFFPPVSVLRNLVFELGQPGIMHEVVANKRHIIGALAGEANTEIYDFQAVEHMVADFSHYYDPGHFTREIGQAMLIAMAQGQHRATVEGADDMLDLLESRPPAAWLAMIGVAENDALQPGTAAPGARHKEAPRR